MGWKRRDRSTRRWAPSAPRVTSSAGDKTQGTRRRGRSLARVLAVCYSLGEEKKAERSKARKEEKPMAEDTGTRHVPELWGATDIARYLGWSYGRVSLYIAKGYAGFPPHVAKLARGRLWEAATIRAWARDRGYVKKGEGEEREEEGKGRGGGRRGERRGGERGREERGGTGGGEGNGRREGKEG